MYLCVVYVKQSILYLVMRYILLKLNENLF